MKIKKYLPFSILILSSLGIPTIMSVLVNDQKLENNSQNLIALNDAQEQNNSIIPKITESTILTNAIVFELGWNVKPTITLEDWRTSAPNVVSIDDHAFIIMPDIKKMEIPAQITFFGVAAFQQSGIIEMIFENGSQLETISHDCFAYSNIVNIEIPASVKTFGKNAFRYSSSISEVTFAPNSQLTTVGPRIFGDSSLKKISMPKINTDQGDGIFLNTSQLTDITLYYNLINNLDFLGLKPEQHHLVKWISLENPDATVLTPDILLYVGWDKKTKISLQDWEIMLPNVTSIDKGFENNNILESLIIPARITTITAKSIVAHKLTSLEFEDNSKLTSIGDYGINNTLIESIIIPESVETIGIFGLGSNSMLKSVILPDGLKVIEAGLFFGSSEIEGIKIPDSLIAINDNAFQGLNKLTEIKIPSTIVTIGVNAFDDTPQLTTISLLSIFNRELTNFGFTQTQWDGINWILVPTSSKILTQELLFQIGWNSKKEIKLQDWRTMAPNIQILDYTFNNNQDITSIEIPNNIIYFKSNPFKNTQSLKGLKFEKNSKLQFIGDESFFGSSLKSIAIPDSVVFISANAFQNTELNNIKVPLKFQNYLDHFGLTDEQWNKIIWTPEELNVKFIATTSTLFFVLIIQGVLLIRIAKSIRKFD